RLMEAFPISYAEINPTTYANPIDTATYAATKVPIPLVYQTPVGGTEPYIPDRPAAKRRYMATYQKTLAGKTGTGNWQRESSACLLMALSAAKGGAQPLGVSQMESGVFHDTDNDGLKEICDAWGTPMAFFRFPTGNAELEATAPKAGTSLDQMDSKGTLLNASWYGSVRRPSAQAKAFENLIHPIKDATHANGFF